MISLLIIVSDTDRAKCSEFVPSYFQFETVWNEGLDVWVLLSFMETNLYVSLSTLLSPLSPCFASQSFKVACMCVCVQAWLCLILCNPMDCSPPGSSVYGISQARILLWAAIYSSGGSSQSRYRTHISRISCISGQILYHWAPWKAPTVAYKDIHNRLKEIQDQ